MKIVRNSEFEFEGILSEIDILSKELQKHPCLSVNNERKATSLEELEKIRKIRTLEEKFDDCYCRKVLENKRNLSSVEKV